MTVAAVVLAAGASRRLGRSKQTLALGQDTVLGTTLQVARRSRPERVVVVLGGAADDDRASVFGIAPKTSANEPKARPDTTKRSMTDGEKE